MPEKRLKPLTRLHGINQYVLVGEPVSVMVGEPVNVVVGVPVTVVTGAVAEGVVDTGVAVGVPAGVLTQPETTDARTTDMTV